MRIIDRSAHWGTGAVGAGAGGITISGGCTGAGAGGMLITGAGTSFTTIGGAGATGSSFTVKLAIADQPPSTGAADLTAQ